MRPKPLHSILGLLALFGAVRGGITSVDTECTTRAWVRAPDLAPSKIIQGDVRVKIGAGCPAVETVSLGLRFKERSFIRALRSQEDRTWMKSAHPLGMDPLEASPWAYPPSRSGNRSNDVVVAELLANKGSWIVREEERIVFETMQPIHMMEGASGVYDVVQDFAVLVPSTNFPPAQNYLDSVFTRGGLGDMEIVDVESMNEYFIRVSFANGTTEDILAGFTGFEPLWAPVYTPRPEAVRLEPVGFAGQDTLPTNYTVQVSGGSSLVFTEGSEQQFVTVIITRTGFARRFDAPLTVRGCVEPVISSKWAVEHDMTSSKPWHSPGQMLRSTLKDVEAKFNLRNPPCLPSARTPITMPNPTLDETRSREVVTTTSEPVTIPVKVNRRHITNFDAYYQTIANSLVIMLETPRTDGETVDPDDPFGKFNGPSPLMPVFEDDEGEWVPWRKEKTPAMSHRKVWHTYRGPVPVTVRPIGEATRSQNCVHASMVPSDQLALSNETCSVQPSLIHYLNDGARGPIFVDPSAVRELLAEDPVERELRAPILEPVVSTPPEGEELIFRYYHGRLVDTNPQKRLIYVGETWARKVHG